MQFLKIIVVFLGLILFQNVAQGQTKHPMQVAMVSLLVEDPVKAFAYYTEVLGFKEVLYSPENFLAIVQSPLTPNGVQILLEPTQPGGIPIAQQFKQEIYTMGLPIMTFSCPDIQKTVTELKSKGVVFKKDPVATSYGYEAIFDDNNGNYIQLIQMKDTP